MIRIPEQVVHTIRIHLTINEITPKQPLLCFRAPFQEVSDIFGREAVIRSVQWMIVNYITKLRPDDCRRVLFMLKFLSVVLIGK